MFAKNSRLDQLLCAERANFNCFLTIKWMVPEVKRWVSS